MKLSSWYKDTNILKLNLLVSDKKWTEPTEKEDKPFGKSPKICNFAFATNKNPNLMDKGTIFSGQPVEKSESHETLRNGFDQDKPFLSETYGFVRNSKKR